MAVVSSDYRRTVYSGMPQTSTATSGSGLCAACFRCLFGEIVETNDTSGGKYSTLSSCARSVRGGGEVDEPGQPAAGVGGRGAATSAGGRGDCDAVRAGWVLPGHGQGAGQIRDAPRAPARRGVGDRGRGRVRLLPGRVLPGRRGVRAGRDERAARR